MLSCGAGSVWAVLVSPLKGYPWRLFASLAVGSNVSMADAVQAPLCMLDAFAKHFFEEFPT
eukprot:8200019-Lingulodinium_polyedra.AAC.1